MIKSAEYMKIYRKRRKELGIPIDRYESNKKYKLAHPEKQRESARRWQLNNYPKMLFNSAKTRAMKAGLEFTISLEDIKIPEYCPILGIKIIPLGNRKEGHGASIDRIDSTLGYTKNNIQIISLRANLLKSNATIEELEKIISFMKNTYTLTT